MASHWILGLGWLPSLLLGAVLSPTDPVMTRAILEHDAVPRKLRRLLSVESGLDDGLALPPITVLLAMLGASSAHPLRGIVETLAGVAIGIAVTAVVAVERLRWFEIAEALPSAGRLRDRVYPLRHLPADRRQRVPRRVRRRRHAHHEPVDHDVVIGERIGGPHHATEGRR